MTRKTPKTPREHYKQLYGQQGEEAANQYLIQRGYIILHRNWRTKFGEIDIIACKTNILYFVEVKTRSSTQFGYPSEAINANKLHRMYRTATMYMTKYNYTSQSQLILIEVLNGSCRLIEI